MYVFSITVHSRIMIFSRAYFDGKHRNQRNTWFSAIVKVVQQCRSVPGLFIGCCNPPWEQAAENNWASVMSVIRAKRDIQEQFLRAENFSLLFSELQP